MSTLAKDAQLIRLDPNLIYKLKKLEYCKTGRTFKRWKNSFMKRYVSFLNETNIKHASAAYEIFGISIEKFIKLLNKVNDYINKGQLTVEQYTVKARMALSEMNKELVKLNILFENLIPKTTLMEINSQYNKFHLGVVLVYDNFLQYNTKWNQVKDILYHMEHITLIDVADKQILLEMKQYNIKIHKFHDMIQKDLELYDVMLKCIEYQNDPGIDLSALIYLDCKTGCIGEIPREDLISKNILTIQGVDENGHSIFNEAVISIDKSDTKLIKIINDNSRLKIGFAINVNQYNEKENVTVSHIENVQNLWGVTLKKTPKNIIGEEFIFIDQYTTQFGELSRQSIIENQFITEIQANMHHIRDYEHYDIYDSIESGTLIIEDAYIDFQERSELVETIRSILNLGIQSK